MIDEFQNVCGKCWAGWLLRSVRFRLGIRNLGHSAAVATCNTYTNLSVRGLIGKKGVSRSGRGLRVHNGSKDDFNIFYTCVKLSKMSFPRRRLLGRGDEFSTKR